MGKRPYAVMIVVTLALAPVAGLAQEKGRGAGGKAREHRSESAEKNSNAQWSEGATRGQERAAERRNPAAGEKRHPEPPRGKGNDRGEHADDDRAVPADRGRIRDANDKAERDEGPKPKKVKK